MHSRPEKSKVTRYETAMQVKKQIGRDPVELQMAPDFPDACKHLWAVFTRLSRVDYQEIQAYCHLTGDYLDRWEIDAIIGLDRARANPPTRFLWLKK